MSVYKRFYPFLEAGGLYISEIKFDPVFEPFLFNGSSLKGMKFPQATVKNATGKAADFLYSYSGKLIVSEKAKKFLETSNDAEYFEFIPIEFTNKKIKPYYLLTILQLVDAFDWELSTYELFDELGPKGNKVIRDLVKMELIDAKINGRKLFSLLNFEGNAIVHIDFVEQMKAGGLTGILIDPLWGHSK